MMRALLTILVLGLALHAGVGAQTMAAKPVTLLFAGDTVLDDEPGRLIASGGDPFADFAQVFAQADIRIANLECVVATQGDAGHKNFTFRAHPCFARGEKTL